MKSVLLLILLSLITFEFAFAKKLSDYKPFKVETLFTNPVCKTYEYPSPLRTVKGDMVDSKPENVYCKLEDEETSVRRSNAPLYRLLEWIAAPDTKEIFMAYLSFRSKNITNALCAALKRGVKVTMILDHGTEVDNPHRNEDAEGLKKCGDMTLHYRGSRGGLGFAHNKIMMVNPESSKEVKIVFSSGNMTTGTSINHENWNFFTTSKETFFIQDHLCALTGMVDAGDAAAKFKEHMKTCRAKITAKPEDDIKVFFVPADGKLAVAAIEKLTTDSDKIDGISHRFSGMFIDLTIGMLNAKKEIRFMFDDDIYWAKTLNRDTGRNTRQEAYKIFDLINLGLDVRFLQTNQNASQLQHNKFMIFDDKTVFTGAGNMTTSAFAKNFENFYVVKIPEIVTAYVTQYEKYWSEMATEAGDMTEEYVLP